jgi:glycerophosphoryl diester phosphodiesterase
MVVHHDAALADGMAIIELAAADLPGHIPTLADALDACQPLSVNIELKNDEADPDFDAGRSVVAPLVALLSSRGGVDRVLVSSFDRLMIEALHAAAPDVPTAFLVERLPSGPALAASMAELAARGHSAIHPHWRAVDGAVVVAAHAAGLLVNVWTCDDPAEMKRLAALGVDGICTNRPDLAAVALAP